MKTINTIFMGGAHRGGRALTDSALRPVPKIKVFDELVIADPKDDRALRLAEVWKKKGFTALGLKEVCQDAINKFRPDIIMLSIDQIEPMADILEKHVLPTQWQLLARGLGHNGPVVGLAGTINIDSSKPRASSVKLIKELSSFISPQSSTNIRRNLLNADILYSIRKRVSEHSVKRLATLGRNPHEIKNGALNFFWGMKRYPLIVQEKPQNQKWKETRQRALEAEIPHEFREDKDFAVATVAQKNVDFFIVESARGRRIIKFYMSLIHALPITNTLPQTEASPAVVTD